MNSLEITFRHSQGVPDRRYRCLVSLMRSDRPRYWNFLCHNCGSKVQELMNYEVAGVDDFFDPQNTANHAVGRHCKGTLPSGLACPYSYFFRLH